MALDLIAPERVPHEWLRGAETFLKRKLYAVEQEAVVQLSRLYAAAYSDLRNTAISIGDAMGLSTIGLDANSSRWREQVEQYAQGRIAQLSADGLRVAAQAATDAARGGYYGKLWELDMLTHERHPINKPLLNASMLQEEDWDRNDVEILSLLGKEWRSQYKTELDSLLVDLRRTMGTGMQNGETIQQIMRRVAGTMGVETDRRRGAIGSAERMGYRANFNRVQTLTRTMVNKVSNDGAYAAFQANADIITGYEWLAARDERTCPQCQGLNGKVYKLTDFMRPPAHPNCRCTIIAVLNREQMANPRETPPETLAGWADGWGMRREIDRFAKMPTVQAPTRLPPTEIRTLDGIYKPRLTNPGDTLDSLNAYMSTADDAVSYAMGDPVIGMLDVDYSRADDYFLINREVVKREAAAFVQESMDIHYSKEYLLQLAAERAAENGVLLTGDMLESAYNATYAARAEAIQTLARIGNVKLTPAQIRRLEIAQSGDYLNMVYSREGSSTGSLANAVRRAGGNTGKPGGSQNMSAGALREARENFREWVQGIE